jgi:Protein of unknown function, DUF547
MRIKKGHKPRALARPCAADSKGVNTKRARITQRGSLGSVCVLLVLLLSICAPCPAAEPDWQDYAALLAAHVKAGQRDGVTLNLVDYEAIARDPRLPLALAALERFPVTQLTDQREWLAFHINAYNLLAINMVVTHRPQQSIKDIGNFLRPVWQRNAGKLAGEAVSLADIEHRRLRPRGDARIHFAIVCASVSCPDLRTEPYRAASLETQLKDQVASFLNNSGKGLRVSQDTVHVSQIFDWFEADFASVGGVAGFIERSSGLPRSREVVTDIDYNWRLNGK